MKISMWVRVAFRLSNFLVQRVLRLTLLLSKTRLTRRKYTLDQEIEQVEYLPMTLINKMAALTDT